MITAVVVRNHDDKKPHPPPHLLPKVTPQDVPLQVAIRLIRVSIGNNARVACPAALCGHVVVTFNALFHVAIHMTPAENHELAL
jgi:hypothetical protein